MKIRKGELKKMADIEKKVNELAEDILGKEELEKDQLEQVNGGRGICDLLSDAKTDKGGLFGGGTNSTSTPNK